LGILDSFVLPSSDGMFTKISIFLYVINLFNLVFYSNSANNTLLFYAETKKHTIPQNIRDRMTMNISRDIDQELFKWKESRSRRPLLVRGARQVGKTYSISEFAKAEFENHVTVNFEERPEFSMCFESLDTKEIVEKISVLSESEITTGKTLLFFDEIQDAKITWIER
jgi:predicted AAA+ superfamily ATPase